MKRLLFAGVAAIMMAGTAHAQNVTLTMTAAQPGGASDVAAKNLAEVAAANKVATIQVQVGQVLTKTMQQVAEGKTDISASAFILKFLMERSLGPYAGVGKDKGKELAGNLRLLYPYHLAGFYLLAFQNTGIESYEDLKGKTVHNGPPRGGALVLARQIIQLTAGLKDGGGYVGKQIAWGQANSIFLDRSVDAAVRPGTNPASFMPVLLSAGKINIVSIPKAKFEGPAIQKLIKSPGRVPIVFPVSDMAHYGPNARVVSDDNMFRTVGDAGGDMVNKNMAKNVAKGLTAAFIKSIPELHRKVPFSKGSLFGEVSNTKMGMCAAGVKLHPGAVEAWEEAGFKIDDCAKPTG